MDGEQRLQQVFLRDVARALVEGARVPAAAVHRQGTLHATRPAEGESRGSEQCKRWPAGDS